MNRTKIEWVLNPDGTPGYTWNPITGCLYHTDGMCKGGGFPCWAYKLANGRLKARYLANPNVAGYDADKLSGRQKIDILEDPFYPRFWPEKIDERMPPVARVQSHVRYGYPCSETFAYRKYNYKPKGIFTCSMSDLFGIGVPEEWTRKVIGVAKCNPKDRFYLLTKQPQNLIKFSPFPDNCYVGVTVCNQAMANESIPVLMNVTAGKRYVSIEPMLESVDLSRIEFGRYLPGNEPYYVNAFEDRYIFGDEGDIELQKIDWLIIGAQSKPTVIPKIEWVQELVEAANKAGIPVFLKDNLRPAFDGISGQIARDLINLCFRRDGAELKLRQEFPNDQK
ncbi:MAG: DUF5131 family protein [Deltaproteobacteria bacterium]|nr:DUF5131 family protein [Deltaproteobacteria bacterium]